MELKTGGKLSVMVSKIQKIWHVLRGCTGKEQMGS